MPEPENTKGCSPSRVIIIRHACMFVTVSCVEAIPPLTLLLPLIFFFSLTTFGALVFAASMIARY